ncbi:hypothetical protein QK289_15550 [Exiguobacterium antarcticum]|uniref:Single-stranded DNA-binding protein n=1 Tax=Exiguobacterium antarcticum TaxID=132920 RepID=A0ABT6R651_9BACL|nr:hypothetical protein [Exiguobacterium antarcticum]MDI3236430.1 hypothetical protein [Exiguobacterium antarcticum]
MYTLRYQTSTFSGRLAAQVSLIKSGQGLSVANFTVFVPGDTKDVPIPLVAFGDHADRLYDEGVKGGTVVLEAQYIEVEKVNKLTGKKETEKKFKVREILGIYGKVERK